MKRANGTGSVTRLSGKRRRPWVVKVSQRDRYGQVIQKIVSYHEKAADAQLALEEYNKSRLAGTAPAADQLSMTVGQVFEAWKERTYRKLKKPSIYSHNAAWKKRVSRYASRKMRSVTLDEWQALLDAAEDEGMSQSTINNVYILIKALFHYSMERDIVGKDYSQYLDVPSVGPKQLRESLNDLQVKQLQNLAEEGVPLADTALILCYTGFRISELLDLTRFSYHPEHGGYFIGGIKTDAGRERIVPIHPTIRPYVMSWLEKDGETIFCNKEGKRWSSSNYREKFKVLMESIDAPNATPHWCRHTFATKLHQAKVDRLTVKWLMGHSTKGDVTERYTHATIEVLEEAVKRIS